MFLNLPNITLKLDKWILLSRQINFRWNYGFNVLGWVNTTRKVNFVRLKWTSIGPKFLQIVFNKKKLCILILFIFMNTHENVWEFVHFIVIGPNNQFTNRTDWTTLSIRAENQICSTTLIYTAAACRVGLFVISK